MLRPKSATILPEGVAPGCGATLLSSEAEQPRPEAVPSLQVLDFGRGAKWART